jgi:hypothetical protein
MVAALSALASCRAFSMTMFKLFGSDLDRCDLLLVLLRWTDESVPLALFLDGDLFLRCWLSNCLGSNRGVLSTLVVLVLVDDWLDEDE